MSYDPEKAKKVRHVKKGTQSRRHECHWPGCDQQVPPSMWGCYKHWMKLPQRIRAAIWAAYKPGQETRMTPSKQYVRVAREAQDWIKEHYPNG